MQAPEQLPVTSEFTAQEDTRPFVDKSFAFHFRKDDKGKKRDSINIVAKVPTIYGLAEIFNRGGKDLTKMINLVEDAIEEHIRNVLTEGKDLTAANFPLDQATWEAYVAVPDTERKLRGIAKEIWEAFKADYEAVMPAIVGKSVEQIKRGAKLLIDERFSSIKSDKKVVAKLQEYLALYSQTPNAEQFADCLLFLNDKAEILLKADSTELLENI